MQLTELEKAVRGAIRKNPTQPALAVLGADRQASAQLPAEFDAAARRLADVLKQEARQGGNGRVSAIEWF